MSDGLDYNQVFQLQMRETIRTYVRELAGWEPDVARDANREAIELIERAKDDPKLAENLLEAEPTNLDELINGTPTKRAADPT